MTPKVTVTFVVGLTYIITPKGYGVIRRHRDLLYDHKSHGDFVVSLTQFMTPRGHGVTRDQLDLLFDP